MTLGTQQSYFNRNLTEKWNKDTDTNSKINIKRSYDFYSGGYDGKKFKGGMKSFNSGDKQPRNEGKWDDGFLAGRSIGKEWDGTVKSLQIPVGLWATVYNDEACKIDTPTDIDYGKLNVYWGLQKSDKDASNRLISGTDFDGKSIYPEYIDKDKPKKIPEPISTVCSVGKKNTNKKGNYLGSDGKTQCWVGASSNGDGGNCVRSGLHLGSYCQLGDNINSDICKKRCEGIDEDEDHYCNWSKKRLCNKGINENVVGNDKSGKWWFKESVCEDYCHGDLTPSNRCIGGWTKYCSDNKNWKGDKGEKCSNVFKSLNNKEFNQYVLSNDKNTSGACSGELRMSQNGHNIFSGNCSGLCKNIETNPDKQTPMDKWCINQKVNFCSDHKNMASEHCLTFSKKFPDDSENNLNNFCKDVKEIDDMEKNVTKYDTKEKVRKGHWCGCVASDTYYTNYTKKLEKDMNLKEYDLNTQGLIGIKKCYGSCLNDSAPKPGIVEKEGDCPICIQNINTNIGSMTDSTIDIKQDSKCFKRKIQPTPHEDPGDKPKPTPHDDPSDKPNPTPHDDPSDKPKPSSDPDDDDDPRRKIIIIGAAIAALLIILILFSKL